MTQRRRDGGEDARECATSCQKEEVRPEEAVKATRVTRPETKEAPEETSQRLRPGSPCMRARGTTCGGRGGGAA